MAPSARRGGGSRRSPSATSIRTSTTTSSTGARTTTRPRWRSGSRPRGRVTHFVAGLGTSGTFIGVGRRLRELNPAITLVSVQPESPLHGLEGLKHMASAIVPGIYDAALADVDLGVSTEDAYRADTPAGRDAGTARRDFQRSRAGRGAEADRIDDGEGPSREAARDRRDDLSGRRRALSVGAASGARTARGGDAAARRARRDSRARPRDVPERMLRRAHRRRRRRDRSVRAAEHDRRRAAPAISRSAVGLPERGRPRHGGGTRAARVLSLASRSSGPAVAVRPRSRVAVFFLRDRLGARGRAARAQVVAPARRSIDVRRRRGGDA